MKSAIARHGKENDIEKAALDYLDRNRTSKEPFFMSINFMKVHQPNMPARAS